MLRRWWVKDCPHVAAQQAAARAHLKRSLAKEAGMLVEMDSPKRELQRPRRVQATPA